MSKELRTEKGGSQERDGRFATIMKGGACSKQFIRIRCRDYASEDTQFEPPRGSLLGMPSIQEVTQAELPRLQIIACDSVRDASNCGSKIDKDSGDFRTAERAWSIAWGEVWKSAWHIGPVAVVLLPVLRSSKRRPKQTENNGQILKKKQT